jgi:sugar-specific transcriptional regulator TrmB
MKTINTCFAPGTNSLKNQEKIETLTRLGLTMNQARAYLTLCQSGPAGAKKLSDLSKITRQDIYRVMPTLEKTGIVERLIITPTVYKAIPIKHGTSILLKRRAAEQNKLRKKIVELVREVENNHAEREIQEESTRFTIVPGKEAIIQKLGQALQRIQTSLDVVTSCKRFSPAILEFAEGYEKALERGVKIRIAAEKHVVEKAAFGIVQTLTRNPRIEVRYFPDAPEAIVSIFDRKEASVTISAIANLGTASALWSNDASFVALSQNYFENKWNNSTN